MKSFWNKVNKEADNGCWEWTASKDNRGYGLFYPGNKKTLAHRYSAALAGMPIENQCVCHKCDNPKCVNPDHFFLGTREDNNKDRARKLRGPNKFNLQQVEYIRTCNKKGVDLAKELNTTETTISLIRNRHFYKEVA